MGPLPFVPPAFSYGGILLNDPESTSHEWAHFFYNHSNNHFALAEALSGYDIDAERDHKELNRIRNWKEEFRRIDTRISFNFSNPRKGSHSITMEPSRVDGQFESRDFFANYWTNGKEKIWNTPAMHFGRFLRVLEDYRGKPGLGLILIKQVTQGMKAKDAIQRSGSKTVERQRIELARKNPSLNWLKKPGMP